jgi:hypothetical protein
MLDHQKDHARKRVRRKRVGGELLSIHCPADMKEAVVREAERQMVSGSAYARQAIRDRLQADRLQSLDGPVVAA